MTDPHKQPGPIRPYGTAIHNCIAEGDHHKMKQLSAETQKYVAEVKDALGKLKAEIAKAAG